MHYGFSEGYKSHLNGDYPIYTQTSFSDKITENTKEKGRREHMSFVGLTFFKDHIIGYGDTKSSRFVDGAFQDDKKRQRVLKIFKTRDYIVCTYDINSFKTVGEDSKEIFIEDWLKENMNEVTYPEDLFKRFHDYLMKHENLFAFFQIYDILLFEREKFFLQKNRDSKFSIILIIKEIMVNKKRRKKL